MYFDTEIWVSLFTLVQPNLPESVGKLQEKLTIECAVSIIVLNVMINFNVLYIKCLRSSPKLWLHVDGRLNFKNKVSDLKFRKKDVFRDEKTSTEQFKERCLANGTEPE